MQYICTAVVATFALVGTSFAATINVPGDHATIQGAVDAATTGDLILVSPGTYTSNGQQVVDMLGKEEAAEIIEKNPGVLSCDPDELVSTLC